MCYSFKTSIISYTLGMISSIYALLTKQYILGMLILFYSQIQLSEAFIWRGIDTDNSKLNRFGTTFGKYMLATHNIGIGLGILLYMYNKHKKLQKEDFIPLIIGFLFFLFISLFIYSNKDPKTTYPYNKKCIKRDCQNSFNRLNWEFPQWWYIIGFIISLVLFYLYIPSLSSTIFLSFVFTFTLLLSLIKFPFTSGSLWCFLAAIVSPIIVVINNKLNLK